MQKTQLPFKALFEQIISDLVGEQCVALAGLSNSGKSTLMRALASPQAKAEYSQRRKRNGALVYVDCNRAVAISAQAFYEVVIRSLLEQLNEQMNAKLSSSLREHHQSVTEAETAFSASLSFNLALTDLCEQLGSDLCLLIDEFDEIYTALDDRALLNLRALRDRFSEQLLYVTATIRNLTELRGYKYDDEFAEIFMQASYMMPLMEDKEAKTLIETLELPGMDPERLAICLKLGGGHPGLLKAVAKVFSSSPEAQQGDPTIIVGKEPQPRAECLKIWNQLTKDEQANLMILAVESDAGIPEGAIKHLQRLGLVRANKIFSPIFTDFLVCRGQGAKIGSEGIHLDDDSGDVWVDGIRIPVLTDLEFRLLKLVYQRMDKLTDKYRIVTAVWGEDYLGEVDDARVEKLISRLRSKIEPDPADPRYLITRRGRGYKLLSRPSR